MAADRQPRRSRYWRNAKTTAEDPVAVAGQVETSCAVHAYAPLLEALGGHVVSTDELTGIQALERAAPPTPVRPGCPERRAHEDIRHGTLSRSANFNVATGQVLAPAPGPTRTDADFAAHSARTIATDPDGTWRFLTDHRNTHHSATRVRLVAQRCGSTDDWGVNGQAGVLRSRATRAALRGDPRHRIPFLYTPQHPSWRKQIERWFSILARRVLKRGTFASLDARRDRILAVIASCNQTAHPFRWTYTGRALCL